MITEKIGGGAGTCTLNTARVEQREGTPYYYKIGRLVFFDTGLLASVSEIPTWEHILSGLPAAAETVRFYVGKGIGATSEVQTFRITKDTGMIVVAESGNYPYNTFLTISGVYLAKE